MQNDTHLHSLYTASNEKPLIAVMANSGCEDELPFQSIDDKYLKAVIDGLDAIPIIIPTLFNPTQIQQALQLVDGIILTGDTSNINPARYKEKGTHETHGPFDTKRDDASLFTIQFALEHDIPMLGICRGMQEMNIALGGSLQTGIIHNSRYAKHLKMDYSHTVHERYAPAHQLEVSSDGLLYQLTKKNIVNVNSLHEQAIARLGQGLIIDAVSEDGLIEAFHHPKQRFFFAVQWHVEYNLASDCLSQAIFHGFKHSITPQTKQAIIAEPMTVY